MKDADYFIGINTYDFNGCVIEREVFELYKRSGKTYFLDLDTFAPDITEMLRKESCAPTIYADDKRFET